MTKNKTDLKIEAKIASLESDLEKLRQAMLQKQQELMNMQALELKIVGAVDVLKEVRDV